MGNNETAPLLNPEELELSLHSEEIEMIPYSIKPDHPIKSLLLAHNNIFCIPPRLENLETLDMSYNNLGSQPISDVILEYPKLEHLYLSGNGITGLPHIIFTFSHLKDLIADRNQIGNDSLDLSQLSELQNIDFILNFFREIPKLPPSLISLNMGFNSIGMVNLCLDNLTELRLPGNEIKEFSSSCRFPMLKVLDLSMNSLDDFPNVSEIAPILTNFDLSYNFLNKFPDGFPETITKINVSHNFISEWEEGIKSLPNLTELKITDNQLNGIPELPPQIITFMAEKNRIASCGAFTMPKVAQLQLDDNSFDDIPDLTQCGVTSLHLARNQISKISIDRLGPNINNLDFTKNIITEVSAEVFMIERLHTLNLTANNITALPAGIELSKVTALYISQNPISTLPALPQSLITLFAIDCQFEELPESIMNLQRLSRVNFSNNKIKKVDILPKSSNILLSCNEIEELPEIPENLTFLDISHNKLRKLTLRGEFIMVQELDASHNQITSFEHDNLPVMHTLKLSHNPLNGYKVDYTKLPALRCCDFVYTKAVLDPKVPDRMREILTSERSIFKAANSIRMRLIEPAKAGYSETVGTRPSMEDSIIIRHNVVTGLDVYGVIDGHGGAETASYAAYFLPQYFSQEKNKSIGSFSAVVRRLNERLRKARVRDGATVAFAVVTKDEVGCAYLGDTRALIVRRDGTVVPLSFDHKPTERAEIVLLKENRSFVADNRTAGILAVSRSLGDFGVDGVTRVPDMTSHKLNDGDAWLLLACDGVFDVLTDVEVGAIVAAEGDPARAATKVRNIASARLSMDNISVIVVSLQ